jgi:hypothetical protein
MAPASAWFFCHLFHEQFEDQHGVVPGESRSAGREHRQRAAEVLDFPHLIQIVSAHAHQRIEHAFGAQVARVRGSGEVVGSSTSAWGSRREKLNGVDKTPPGQCGAVEVIRDRRTDSSHLATRRCP